MTSQLSKMSLFSFWI